MRRYTKFKPLCSEMHKHSEHDKELLRLLAKGEREIETGEGYDLDTVLAEVDSLQAPEPLEAFFKGVNNGLSKAFTGLDLAHHPVRYRLLNYRF